ncbi:MAG: hypothetical protein GWP06_04245 [Actinobacteria bacterium]|nr:hypothetical protein [Actinomycetota bacterium]
MEMNEHFYSEDPTQGPSDVKTTLKDVNYFFLGNGLIQAAVQVCAGNEGTPLGLLLMNPDNFTPKRGALTFDAEKGLQATGISIISDGRIRTALPEDLQATWIDIEKIPAVQVVWQSEDFGVCERFYCPDRQTSRLVREIRVQNLSKAEKTVSIRTGIKEQFIERECRLKVNGEQTLAVAYQIENASVSLHFASEAEIAISDHAQRYWQNTPLCDFSSPALNHLFTSSKYQLQAPISHSGLMDASIWQYNLEWVRDQANVVMGLTVSGQFELAGTLLDRMLRKFVTKDGDTVDSGKVRPPEETELDQNGVLLLALKTFVDWTGDIDLVKQHWDKIYAVAKFPLTPIFAHSRSGLLHNSREYWERHNAYGIVDGFEMAYQVYVSVGLDCAACLARLIGKEDQAREWGRNAKRIKKAMLTDSRFSLVRDDHLIKRRKVNGEEQEELFPPAGSNLPSGVPLADDIKHLLNPDSSTALPIVLDFIDPKSELAVNTLVELEKLWNMNWSFGGYSRYNISSEPDSPGPWPLASLLIAQAYFEAGDDEKVWRVINWLNSIPGSNSGAWFEFYGPRPIPPCPQTGIIPWVWAEVQKLFIHHILGIRLQWETINIRPRLLKGIEKMEAVVRIRSIKLYLCIQKAAKGTQKSYSINNQLTAFGGDEIQIKHPIDDVHLQIYV